MRVIQMGMGGMGNAWLGQLSKLPFVELTGFVEVNDKTAKSQATAYNIDETLIFKTLPDALASVEVDAVISIIPPEYRTETLQTCIDANIALMAEKPLAETLEDAYTQVRMANESGLSYVITQDYRYEASLYTIKQILDSGELGTVDSVVIQHYKGLEFVGFRANMPYPLMNDMAVHHFDLLRYFLGAEAVSIYGKSWSPSWNKLSGKMSANALLSFPDDVHASYLASWVTNGQETSYNGNWRFDCSKGVLSYIDGVITVQLRDSLDGIHYTYGETEIREPIEMQYTRQSYLAQELNNHILNGTKIGTRVQDNVKTLQMVFDVIESSETGQIIIKDS